VAKVVRKNNAVTRVGGARIAPSQKLAAELSACGGSVSDCFEEGQEVFRRRKFRGEGFASRTLPVS
jgi:hypothetical protein